MDFKKCTRCGNFYVSEGNVCPKCTTKDNFEFSTFKSYVIENGFDNEINTVSGETGISSKNLNRFMSYKDYISLEKELNKKISSNEENISLD